MKIFLSIRRVSVWAICTMIIQYSVQELVENLNRSVSYGDCADVCSLWGLGGGVTTWGWLNRRSEPNPNNSRWASFPFTRFFVEQMGRSSKRFLEGHEFNQNNHNHVP